ncbi:hypothetical protein A5728_10160 [Kocuria sp. ICS0012]|nr:hypothetical protein A5728_10160 [Kocuria sp. ICS0012]
MLIAGVELGDTLVRAAYAMSRVICASLIPAALAALAIPAYSDAEIPIASDVAVDTGCAATECVMNRAGKSTERTVIPAVLRTIPPTASMSILSRGR